MIEYLNDTIWYTTQVIMGILPLILMLVGGYYTHELIKCLYRKMKEVFYE